MIKVFNGGGSSNIVSAGKRRGICNGKAFFCFFVFSIKLYSSVFVYLFICLLIALNAKKNSRWFIAK